jgi:hypothetical protein
MGDHLCHVPRHGRGVRGRDLRHLHVWSSRSSKLPLPLVILTPIPLTLIGIVLGHMLFNAPFTATSMIGFIALAGDHRAQLDPAGGLHPAHAKPGGQAAARRAA